MGEGQLRLLQMARILRGCTTCEHLYYETEFGEAGCPNCGFEEVDEEFASSDLRDIPDE